MSNAHTVALAFPPTDTTFKPLFETLSSFPADEEFRHLSVTQLEDLFETLHEEQARVRGGNRYLATVLHGDFAAVLDKIADRLREIDPE